jgi:DNA polymerase V
MIGRLFALVDCNNFYVSCERLFRPELRGRPVVVLSNNDGCVISRSAESKALGIKMGVPTFQIRDLIRKHGVVTFSSNYALYADISSRVMQTLESQAPKVEVYSIDKSKLYTMAAQATKNIYGQYCPAKGNEWRRLSALSSYPTISP